MASVYICGDIVNFNNREGLLCSDPLAEIVADADYAVCNFEAPVSGFGTPQPKSGPHLSQLPETVDGLKEQGFDLLLLANNHIMDYGPEALGATMDRAASAGLECMGAGPDADSAYKPLIKVVKGVKTGMINACEAQFGVIDHFERGHPAGYAWINHQLIDSAVLRLGRECDFVIVFAHAGLEFQNIPQKEWRARYRHLCDLGADVVVGSHPHVPQGYENHGDALIFYSLGNFYFDSKKNPGKEHPSYALRLDLRKGEPPSFQPVYYYKSGNRVHPAPGNKQIDLDGLCAMLGEGYTKAHDEMCLEAYEKLRARLVTSILPFEYKGSVLKSVKPALASLFGRKSKKNKDLSLLHLLRNEAYYYAVRHALELRVRNNA